MVVCTFNPSTLETEDGESLWVQGQLVLQSDFQNRIQSYAEKPSLKTNPQKFIYDFPVRYWEWIRKDVL